MQMTQLIFSEIKILQKLYYLKLKSSPKFLDWRLTEQNLNACYLTLKWTLADMMTSFVEFQLWIM